MPKVAWDIVEELQAEAARRRAAAKLDP
ncbi:MAG: hypothetical protein HC852_01505 [Acaryochloridaceae cyanobacterium RU_4_10]|nr:hypothetical protein [Acaryochloridaceae cyanobacterium RU_4_10]